VPHSNHQIKQLLIVFRSVDSELTLLDNGLVQGGLTQSPKFCLQFIFRSTRACQYDLEGENISYGFHRLSGERLLCTQHFIWFVAIHALYAHTVKAAVSACHFPPIRRFHKSLPIGDP
jgi:hypothetical protein